MFLAHMKEAAGEDWVIALIDLCDWVRDTVFNLDQHSGAAGEKGKGPCFFERGGGVDIVLEGNGVSSAFGKEEGLLGLSRRNL